MVGMPKHSKWVFVLPAMHLGACMLAYSGTIIHPLQPNRLGMIFGYILLIDLPVSVVAYMAAWGYPLLALVWIFVFETAWWYLISRVTYARLTGRRESRQRQSLLI